MAGEGRVRVVAVVQEAAGRGGVRHALADPKVGSERRAPVQRVRAEHLGVGVRDPIRVGRTVPVVVAAVVPGDGHRPRGLIQRHGRQELAVPAAVGVQPDRWAP